MRLMHSEDWYLNPRIGLGYDDPQTIVNNVFDMFKSRYSYMPMIENLIRDLTKANANIVELGLSYYYDLIPKTAIENIQHLDIALTEEVIRHGILHDRSAKAALKAKIIAVDENGFTEAERASLNRHGIYYIAPEYIKRSIKRIKEKVIY